MKNLLLFRPELPVLRRFVDSFPHANIVAINNKKVLPEDLTRDFSGNLLQIRNDLSDVEYFEQLLEGLFVDFGQFHGIVLFQGPMENSGGTPELNFLREMIRKNFETELIIFHGVLPYLRNRSQSHFFIFSPEDNSGESTDSKNYSMGFKKGFFEIVKTFCKNEHKLDRSILCMDSNLQGEDLDDLIRMIRHGQR